MIPRIFIHTTYHYGINKHQLILEFYSMDGTLIKHKGKPLHFEAEYNEGYRSKNIKRFIQSLQDLSKQLITETGEDECTEGKEGIRTTEQLSEVLDYSLR